MRHLDTRTFLSGLAVAGVALAAGPGELHVDEQSISILESAGQVQIRVERSSGSDGAVAVDYATADGSAIQGIDYGAAAGTLTWGNGDETDRFVMVALTDDTEGEGTETFTVTLSNPTGGATIRPGGAQTTVRILDDDGGGGGGGGDDDPGTLKFDERTFFALEAADAAIITVERSQGEGGTVTVRYTASSGSATAGADFEAVTGILEWGPGDGGSKSFTVPLVDDSEGEGSETVSLTLSEPTGGAGLDPERSTATLTILDDDGAGGGGTGGGDDRPGVLKLDEASFEVIESGGMVRIVLERSQGGGGAVSVAYTTSDGSATAGDDYDARSGVATWAAGDEGRKSFQVPIFDDSVDEGNETFLVTLSDPTGGATIDPDRASSTVLVLDDDGVAAPCAPGDDLCLVGGRFAVRATWRLPSGTVGQGRPVSLGDGSGLLWFFDESNIEVLVKVLDGCGVPGLEAYWVLFAATTNVDFTLEVTDTQTGLTRSYANPYGQAAVPVQDTTTFATCP